MEQAPQDSNPRPSLTSRMAKFGQQTLSIRTANHAPRPRSTIQQSSSPLSQQDQPKYPIPIPSEKRKKAVKLYHAYRLAERLNRQEPPSATSNDGFHLSVPAPSTSHSIMSFASSKCSDFDGTTDISSVLSFGGDESPSSTKAKAQGDLISFSGDRVKTRVRKRLDPVKKAKAALIRHLGACKGCRDRKVPVSSLAWLFALECFHLMPILVLHRASRPSQPSPRASPASPRSIEFLKLKHFPSNG